MAEPVPAFDHDAALLACARGERQALQAIYEAEVRWLLGVALRIVRNRAAAEDVVHDAFLRIWQRAASFDPQLGSGRGWVYTVVRHCAFDRARRDSREVALDDDALAPLLDAAADMSAGTGDALDSASLQRCMAALDEPRRQSIVYAFVEGYTHEQIAARMATPLGTVKSWIRRGLLSLKECLA